MWSLENRQLSIWDSFFLRVMREIWDPTRFTCVLKCFVLFSVSLPQFLLEIVLCKTLQSVRLRIIVDHCHLFVIVEQIEGHIHIFWEYLLKTFMMFGRRWLFLYYLLPMCFWLASQALAEHKRFQHESSQTNRSSHSLLSRRFQSEVCFRCIRWQELIDLPCRTQGSCFSLQFTRVNFKIARFQQTVTLLRFDSHQISAAFLQPFQEQMYQIGDIVCVGRLECVLIANNSADSACVCCAALASEKQVYKTETENNTHFP